MSGERETAVSAFPASPLPTGLNRRGLRAFAAGALILAAACGRQEPPPAPRSQEPPRELVFYNWAEDMPQSVLAAFTKESGVTVRYETYESQEEAVEKIRGGGSYDDVVLEHDMIPSLVAEGRLAEIDLRNVPNFKNISPNFRDLATDPDKRLAERFIDFLLRPAISAQIINEKYLASANEAALPLVKAEIRSDLVTFPPRELLARAAFFKRLDLSGARR